MASDEAAECGCSGRRTSEGLISDSTREPRVRELAGLLDPRFGGTDGCLERRPQIPGASDRVTRRIETWTAAHPDDSSLPQRRVKVVFPWKAMLIGSLLLTLILNALARLGD